MLEGERPHTEPCGIPWITSSHWRHAKPNFVFYGNFYNDLLSVSFFIKAMSLDYFCNLMVIYLAIIGKANQIGQIKLWVTK